MRWAERQGVSAKQEVVETDEDTHREKTAARWRRGGRLAGQGGSSEREAVERSERCEVLAEMAAERQRANPHYSRSDGTTHTGGGGGRGETQRNLEGDVFAPIRTKYRK